MRQEIEEKRGLLVFNFFALDIIVAASAFFFLFSFFFFSFRTDDSRSWDL